MTATMQVKTDKSRLDKLIDLEAWIRYEQLGESDKEYREHLESLRLRVVAEVKIERMKNAV